MFSLVSRLVFLNLLCGLLVSTSTSNHDGRKVYIVYIGTNPKDSSYAHLHHEAMLEEVVRRYCILNSVNQNLMREKILVCDNLVELAEFASLNGRMGIVMQSNISWHSVNNSFPLPTFYFDPPNINQIKLYIDSNSSISHGAIGDRRISPCNFRSRASFACPHVTSVVYIKTFIPTWSIAAIKSALMTIAVVVGILVVVLILVVVTILLVVGPTLDVPWTVLQ